MFGLSAQGIRNVLATKKKKRIISQKPGKYRKFFQQDGKITLKITREDD